MNVKQLAATLLAGLIVTAGAAGAVAAAPGNGIAPDAGPNDDANETADEAAEDDPMNASEDAEDKSMNDSADADEEAAEPANESAAPADADRRGPPVDMPEQVPDHVEEIHSLINDHLEGAISDLGGAISDVTPDDEQSDETADEEQANANASATPTDVPA